MTVYTQILANSEKRGKTASELADLLVKHKKVEILYEVAAQTSGSLPFIYAVLKLIAGMEKAYEYFPTARIIESWTFLETALGEQLFEGLVGKSVLNANLAGDLTGYTFAIGGVDIDRSVLRAGAKDAKYIDYLIEGFASLDKATWFSELSREGEVLDLLVETAATGKNPDLKSAFEDALWDHAQQVVDGTAKVERLKGSWDAIFQTMDKSFRMTALKRMTEILCDSTTPTDSLLELYGSRLAEAPVLSGNEQRVALLAFPRFLERLRLTELQWLCTVLEKNPNFLTEVPPETRDTLEDRIVNATEQQAIGEEIHNAVHRLAQLAGIDIEKAKEKRKAAASPSEADSAKPPDES